MRLDRLLAGILAWPLGARATSSDAPVSRSDAPVTRVELDASRPQVLAVTADGLVVPQGGPDRLPSGPDGLDWAGVLGVLGPWRLEQRRDDVSWVAEGTGPVVSRPWSPADEADGDPGAQAFLFRFELDPAAVAGSFQSPDVLFALRREAAASPGVHVRLRLPPGTRDVQRARAALDSRPPSERRSGGRRQR